MGAAGKAGVKMGKKFVEAMKNGKVLSKDNKKTMMPYYENFKKLVK
jgi:hypothetical protein